jgi:hypothetical protein
MITIFVISTFKYIKLTIWLECRKGDTMLNVLPRGYADISRQRTQHPAHFNCVIFSMLPHVLRVLNSLCSPYASSLLNSLCFLPVTFPMLPPCFTFPMLLHCYILYASSLCYIPYAFSLWYIPYASSLLRYIPYASSLCYTPYISSLCYGVGVIPVLREAASI